MQHVEHASDGAVAYDPKVVTIWEGFKQYFIEHGLDFDYVLYSNYERLVRSLFEGHVHVAWNSPLAWLQARQVADQLGREVKAVAMRDTDVDLRTVIAVRTDSNIRSLEDLRGKVVAVGASDSPQATLIPLWHLQQAGRAANVDFEVQRHELLVGLHGDHVGGERDAAKSLVAGRADAACMIGSNFAAFFADGNCHPARFACWPRPTASIIATSPSSTARPRPRSRVSWRCCPRCRTTTRRCVRCWTWKG